MLVNIGQDMLIEIGTYMDISDAASTASTCKSLHACYTSPLMWPVLISTHFDVNILEKSGISISKPSELAWDEIYELLAKYPKILCAHLPGVHVIIDGAVYDVTGFIDSHPGGDGLLYEYNGADASRVYHLAMHSDQAEIMRAKFLVWSPPQRALPIILRVYKTLTASSASNHMGHGITASVRVNTFLAGTLEKVKVFVHKFIQ
jgi:cytochrome b involved in lipid metabolism